MKNIILINISLASFNEDIQAELVKLKQTTHKNLMYSPATNGVVKFFIYNY